MALWVEGSLERRAVRESSVQGADNMSCGSQCRSLLDNETPFCWHLTKHRTFSSVFTLLYNVAARLCWRPPVARVIETPPLSLPSCPCPQQVYQWVSFLHFCIETHKNRQRSEMRAEPDHTTQNTPSPSFISVAVLKFPYKSSLGEKRLILVHNPRLHSIITRKLRKAGS